MSNITNLSCTPKLYCIEDFEKHALSIWPQCVKDYYKAGEGDENSLKWNQEVFKKYRILPRVMRDVSKRDLSTTVLGEKVSMPLGISPTAFQQMAHPDGECGTAKAADAAKIVLILSCYTNFDIHKVARIAPGAIKWMQLFIFLDRDLTLHFVRKAEEAGFKALVLVVDNPVYGKSKIENFEVCMEKHIKKIAVFEEYLSTKSDLASKYLKNMNAYVGELLDASVTWNDVVWLRSVTKLPIVLKGILTVEDALLGVKSGASAIFVSNHGGRQLDGLVTPVEILPDIVKAVGDQVEVYVDGGVRRGTDAYKALAMGARMVFIGRPMLWGLACGGEKGSRAVIEILRKEIDQAFALTGCTNVKQVTREMIAHESRFNR